jgi:hypothetical protein
VKRNPFEDAARAKKAAALLAAVDRNSRFVGMAALAGSSGVASLRILTRADWAALARSAGVRAPSKGTIDVVLASIEARGLSLAKCAAVAPEQLALPKVAV